MKEMTDEILRIMWKYKILTDFTTNKILETTFWCDKDKLPELQTPEIYIGQASRATQVGLHLFKHEIDLDYKIVKSHM